MRNVEGRDLYLCPGCGSIYEKRDGKFHYVGKLSGGVAIKEFINNIEILQKE
jgi:hypothetical protein